LEAILAHPSARAARLARNKKTRATGADSFTSLARPVANPSASSDKTLLPLGALMLAVSVSGWAQSITPTPSTGTTTATSSTSATPVEGRSLAPVTVTGTRDRASQTYQSGITSVGKMPVPAKDVPQSLTVVNEKLMHDQGKDSFKSALENVVGITFEAGEGGRVGDNIRIRGFSAAGDIYTDGMRDIAQYNRDNFNTERVEVLRGAASMLFGRGSTGGVINQVSKQPRLITEHEVNATVGTKGYQRYQGDFNFKLDDDAAFRINAMATDGDGRGENASASTHRRGLAMDYRFGIGTANEFEISYYHLHYNDKPDWGFAWFNSRPAPGTDKYWYGLNTDFQNDKADAVTLSHTHRWTDGSSLKTTVRDGYYSRTLRATQASFAAGTTLANLNANTVVSRGNTSAGNAKAGNEHHTFLQTDYLTTTQWFGRKNSLLIGAEYAVENSDRFSYPFLTGAKPSTTVGNPISAGIGGNYTQRLETSFNATTLGLYMQDTIDLTPYWKLIAGLRLDNFKADYERPTATPPNNGTLARSDRLLSKRLGVMYQPTDEVSYYAAFGTAFNTSGDLYQFDALSANTPPEKSRNTEIGAKWELYGGDLSIRAALARTEKYNERNTDIDTASPTSFLLSGKRHTDALEFEVAGRITPQWDVFAGIGFMKAKIDKTTTAAELGQDPGLSPSRQANLFTTYRIGDKWRIGGGFTAVSTNKPANAVTATNRAPGYVKADALVEYRINEGNTVKLNIDNLFDKVYYNTLYRGFAAPGDARSVRVTLTSKF
jgi:catecholate siderophore receptor